MRAEVKDFRSANPDIKKPATFFDNVIADIIHKVNDKSRAGV